MHSGGLLRGAWDTITIVPSSIGRPGPHPLTQTISMVPEFATNMADLLQATNRPAGHLAASDQGFTVASGARGRRVLLVDDTFTSGAEVQSAASALQTAGATIPVAVVLGRYIDPEFSQAASDLWERAHARPFSFDRCCLCDQPWS
jgi:hypothetical protein